MLLAKKSSRLLSESHKNQGASRIWRPHYGAVVGKQYSPRNFVIGSCDTSSSFITTQCKTHLLQQTWPHPQPLDQRHLNFLSVKSCLVHCVSYGWQHFTWRRNLVSSLWFGSRHPEQRLLVPVTTECFTKLMTLN